MGKKVLSIKSTYVPYWGVFEGVREVLQNAKDEEEENGSPMKVSHRETTLRIKNQGATLTTDALLLGETTKAERSDLRGQFGEGLDLGLLALVRAGLEVSISTPYETWRPAIERSDDYNGAEVLVINTRKRRTHGTSVDVVIKGIAKDEWDEMKKLFLFLYPPKAKDMIKTKRGTLLLGEDYKGEVYVKGIFVDKKPELTYGYDLLDAELDRDRRMIEEWDLRWKLAGLVEEALGADPDKLREPVYQMLKEDSLEVRNLGEYDWREGHQEMLENLAARFEEEHGPDALPVSSMAESKEAAHLDKKGIVVPNRLRQLLEKKRGSFLSVKQSLKEETVQVYNWTDLETAEQSSLEQACEEVSEVVESYSPVMDRTLVCDFRDPKLQGLADFDNGIIKIAKRLLKDPFETLQVVIHEIAHLVSAGGDGTKSHGDAVQMIWKGVYIRKHQQLLERQQLLEKIRDEGLEDSEWREI